MEPYFKIINFLEAHIELVKVLLYGLSPIIGICFIFRFAAEGQYIEISNVKDLLRDILILHDKGWIHGLSDATPYTICIDIKLLPLTRKIAEQKSKQGI